MKKEKKLTAQEARKAKAAAVASEKTIQLENQNATSLPSSCKAVALSSSTPRKARTEKLKEITCVTTLETILETFQNQQDMTTPE